MANTDVTMKKKRKSHKGLVIFLIIIFIVIILPISLLYICFFDGGHFNNSLKLSMEQTFTNVFSDSLRTSTEDDSRIDIKLGKDEINVLLKEAFDKLPEGTNSYIPSLYAEMNDDKCIFVAEIKVPLFKSKVRLITSIDTFVNDTYPVMNGKIIFKIEDVKLGRVSNLKSISFFILKKYVSEDVFNDAFANAGLSLKMDYENSEITYTFSSLISDSRKIMNNSTDDDLLFDILEFLISNGELKASSKTNAIHIEAPLNGLTISSSDKYPLRNTTFNNFEDVFPTLGISGIITNLETMLNASKLKSSEVRHTFEYLLRGYDYIGEDTRDYIKTLDLSSFGISDYKAHKGLDVSSDDLLATVKDDFNKNIVSNPTAFVTDSSGLLGAISEELINETLHGVKVVGESYIFEKIDEDDKHYLTYVYIQDVSCNIFNNHLLLDVPVSINGKQICFTFETTLKESSSKYSIDFAIDNIFIGSKVCSETLTNSILNLLKEAQNEWFSVSTNVLSINFEKAIDSIDNAAIKLLLKSEAYTFDISATGDDIFSNNTTDPKAELVINWKKNI